MYEILTPLQSVSGKMEIYKINKKLSRDMRFPTMWHLTSVDLDEPVQPPIKLRNSK